jgi:hypothetical protein
MELAVILDLVVASDHSPQACPQRLTGLVCLFLTLAVIRLGGTGAVGLVPDGRAVRVRRLPKDRRTE